jgi:hypothetical protein
VRKVPIFREKDAFWAISGCRSDNAVLDGEFKKPTLFYGYANNLILWTALRKLTADVHQFHAARPILNPMRLEYCNRTRNMPSKKMPL